MDGLLPMTFLKALGWSLLHSLWQMGVLSCCYFFITRKGRAWSPKIRHNLALLFSIGGTACFFFTLAWEYYNSDTSLMGSFLINEETYHKFSILNSAILPVLSAGYLLSIAFLAVRFFRQFQVTHQLRTGPSVKAPIALRLFLRDTAARLGIGRKIEIRLSEWINTPLTIGFWKPVILLPVALMNHLNMQQAESILLHELNHIRRNDYLINLFITALDILLFFNPFSRYFTSTIIRERENDCDDMVLQFRYQPAEYATALWVLEQQRLKPLPVFTLPATGFNKKMLLQRIQRILYGRTLPQPVSPKLAGILLFALLISSLSVIKGVQVPSGSTAPLNTLQLSTPVAFLVESGNNQPVRGNMEQVSLLVNKPTQVLKEPMDANEKERLAIILKDLKYQLQLEQAAAAATHYSESEFAAASSPRDYSLSETNLSDPSVSTAPAEIRVEPYIPAYSFSYQTVQDSGTPKTNAPATIAQESNEDLTKTLKALEAIDWKALEKQLKASKNNLDIAKLQLELKKAIAAVDWKKIQSESLSAIQSEEEALLLKNAYQKQLENFRQQEKLKKEYENKVKAMILNDRLNQQYNLQAQKEQQRLQNITTKKARKIVVI